MMDQGNGDKLIQLLTLLYQWEANMSGRTITYNLCQIVLGRLKAVYQDRVAGSVGF